MRVHVRTLYWDDPQETFDDVKCIQFDHVEGLLWVAPPSVESGDPADVDLVVSLTRGWGAEPVDASGDLWLKRR